MSRIEWLTNKQTANSLTNQRNTGIDLLRIISMLMIVILHVIGVGGLLSSIDCDNNLTYWAVWFLEIFAYGAVNCYALISGYVGITSKYRISNLIMLWLRVEFYSVLIPIVFRCFGEKSIGKFELLSSLFPVFTNEYWYFTSYFILFLFIPLLNQAVNHLEKRQFRMIIIAVIVVVCIIYPIFRVKFEDGFALFDGYSPFWLMILYLFGAYIRKYKPFAQIKNKVLLSIFFFSIALTLFSKIIIQIVTVRIIESVKYDNMWVSYISFTVLVSSVSLFLLFERFKGNRVVNRINCFFVPLAFSVYLIHMNPYVWRRILNNHFIWILDYPLYSVIPLVIGSAICIFLICCGIDLFRYYLFRWIKLKRIVEALIDKTRNHLAKQQSK